MTGASERRADLLAALRDADAVRYGEFELSHGGTSEYYVDKYRFETDPTCLALIAEADLALESLVTASDLLADREDG